MATITPTRIDNRLGAVVSIPPATTNAGPTTHDIGADGTAAMPSHARVVFDVTLTSTGGGDIADFAVPAGIQAAGHNPQNQAGCGIGLVVTVTPMNATAVTGAPFIAQGPTLVRLTFAAAAAGAVYRISFDAMHSVTR